MNDNKLSAFLFSKTRRGLLALLYGRPDEMFYINQLMQATGSGSGAVQRELKLMTEAGVVLRVKKGNLVYYQANSHCPIFNELKSIVTKTFGVAEVLRNKLNPLESHITNAFIYGSVARGEATSTSDIDLMVIGDVDEIALHNALITAEKQLSRPVNYSLMSREEFQERLDEKGSFFTRIMSGPKIIILGNVNGI